MERLAMKILGLIALLSIAGVSVSAADAPPSPMIAATWACSYKDGKSVDDVLKARDFMISQADKAALVLPPSFLWTLAEGDVHIDYVWFNVHMDTVAFGNSADAWKASDIGPAVLERFSSVSDCIAITSAAQMIFPLGNPGASAPDGPVFIAAQSCSFIDGASEEELRNLFSHMHDVMHGMGDKAPAFATALLPFAWGASGAPDVVLYAGYENATRWSRYLSELRSTEAGQRLRNQTSTLLECAEPTLWTSQYVVGVSQ